MKLKDLILPKWRHSNPKVRIKAVTEMDSANFELVDKILLEDPDNTVRIAAIQKSNNIQLLRELLVKTTNSDVANALNRRLNTLIKDQILSSDDTHERIDLISLISDENVMTELAVAIDDPRFRAVIVEQISSPKLLCTIAESNCGVKAGGVVVEKINDVDVLKRLVTSASNKKIRKKAAEKLHKLSTVKVAKPSEKMKKGTDETSDMVPPSRFQSTEERLNQIIDTLKTLDLSKGVDVVKQRLEEETENWVSLDSDFSTDLFRVFFRLKETLIQQIPEAEKREVAIVNLEACIAKMDSLNQSEHLSDKDIITSVSSEFQELLKALKTKDRTLFQDKLDESLQKAKNHFEAIEQNEEQLKRLTIDLNELIDEIQKIQDEGPPEERESTLKALLDEWDAKTKNQQVPDSLAETFEKAEQKVKNDIIHSKNILVKQQESHKKALSEAFACVEKAASVSGNELFSFVSKVKDAKQLWSRRDVSLHEYKDNSSDLFYRHCRDFYEKLDEHKSNKDWEKWANLNRKKELCDVAEKVASTITESVEFKNEISVIRKLQSEWKETGPVAKEHSDAIWKRFNEACDIVYHTCLEKKKALYENLMVILDGDEENFNVKATKIKDIQKAWDAIGSLPANFEKETRDNFHAECDAFFEKRRDYFQKKDEERLENLKIKTGLCEEAEHYADSKQWNKAALIYKDLQKKWKETGPVPNTISNELWERFTKSCNQFYDAYDAFRESNLIIKKGYCDLIETLKETVLDHVSAGEACIQVIDLQKKWKNIGPVPHKFSDELWNRFRAACDSIFDQRSELTSKALEDQAGTIEQKEALVIKAETLADSYDWGATTAELKEIQNEWKSLEKVVPRKENELWARLRTACDTFFNRQRDVFEEKDKKRNENLVLKEEACLMLELFVKIAIDDSFEVGSSLSPAELLLIARDLRHIVEVPGDKKATLKNVMKRTKEIQTQWKQYGPAPASMEKTLWKRYKAATDKLYASS